MSEIGVWPKTLAASLWQYNSEAFNKTTSKITKEHFQGSKVVLDVGCAWQPYGPIDFTEVIGLELSVDMMSYSFEGAAMVRGTALKIPVRDNAFDTVYSRGMLRHLKTWKIALGEMIRVCNRKIIFSHLVSDTPGVCGPHQWSVREQEILDMIPYTMLRKQIIKTWATFMSVLYIAELRKDK